MYDTFVVFSWRRCCENFHRKYCDSTVPCKTIIYNIVTKLHLTGPVLYKKRSWKRHLMTEEKLDDIMAWLEASLKKLLCLLALQCGLAECTAHINTKFLKLWPYKSTLVQSHLPPDCEVSRRYCVVSGIGIQRTFWSRTYVLFWLGLVHLEWLHIQPE